jgi:hypothetical protein
MIPFASILRDTDISDSASINEKRILLNEAVNFDKQCIFIAVPKAGSTSIRSQVRQEGHYLINNSHLNITQIRESLYVYFLMEVLGSNQLFPSNKMPTDAQIRDRASTVFKTFFKFGAVRNPWARAVSLYLRREGVVTSSTMSFPDFCKHHFYASDTCKHPTLHQNQYDWLCDTDGRLLMDYVYRLEDYDEAIKDIEKMSEGRICLSQIYTNVNPRSQSHSYRELYSSETRKMIEVRFAKDIDTFKYSF